MKEQQALLQKAARSLEAAKRLKNDEDYDFSVSRAYYALFYIAEAFLLGESLTFSKHSAVISAFGSHFVKTGKVPSKFHNYLIRSQNQRLAGDYNYVDLPSVEDAELQIDRAKEFLAFAKQYLADKP